MLTKEQIKNLKPGDPVVISTTFMCVDIDGDIRFNATSLNGSRFVHFISPKHVSLPSEPTLPTPKYDPTRLFKEGDIVRYVERDGRSYVDAPPVGSICRVIVGEDSVGMVSVEFKFSENEEPAVHDVPFYHLELITPAEEQEPYSIDPANTNVLFKYGKKFATFEDDDEAQELCARLNDEWRKEQNND